MENSHVIILSLIGILSLFTIPSAFAEVTIVPAAGSGVPGCEETAEGCFIPGTVTVDVGEVITFYNSDSLAHTFTSGVSG